MCAAASGDTIVVAWNGHGDHDGEWERMVTKNEPQKAITACPDCGQRIALKGKVEPGRRFTCIHCGVELKVVKAEPLKLGRAYAA
jgi:lysine biosynthesis protein LysW